MDVFAALADPVRRSLLDEMAAGPARVVDLAAGRPISRPAVSKHLKVLADAGLVDGDRPRPRAPLRPRPWPGLTPVQALLDRLVLGGSPVTAQALDALATEVRRTARDRRTLTAPHDRRQHERHAHRPDRPRSPTASRSFVTRTFHAPIDDVWAAVTEPERLARWLGTWTGDPATGTCCSR